MHLQGIEITAHELDSCGREVKSLSSITNLVKAMKERRVFVAVVPDGERSTIYVSAPGYSVGILGARSGSRTYRLRAEASSEEVNTCLNELCS